MGRSNSKRSNDLRKCDLFEDLAILAEEEECTAIRKQLANRYRNLIGVWPTHCDEFRLGLERVKAAGGMSPRDLAEHIDRDHQQNGSIFRTGSSSFSGTTGTDSTGGACNGQLRLSKACRRS